MLKSITSLTKTVSVDNLRDATFYQGTMSASGIVSGLDNLDTSEISVVEIHVQGVSFPATFNAIINIEGTTNPSAGAGDAATANGWAALQVLNANSGARSNAIILPGRYLVVNPPRKLRVRVPTFTSGSAQIDLMLKPVADQSPAHWISDQDGLARWILTTFGTGIVAQRAYLCGGDFGQAATLDTTKFTDLSANGGSLVFGNGEVELRTGTGATGYAAVESTRTAKFLAGNDNEIFMGVRQGDTGGADHVFRFGVYDDDNGTFVEINSAGLTFKTRKGGVDTESGFGILGLVKPTNSTANQFWFIRFNPNFLIFYQGANFVQLFISSTTIAPLFNLIDLPVRAEAINLSGSTSHSLYVQSLVANRLGLQETIRADQSFTTDDVLAGTASIIHGQKPDDTFQAVQLTETGDLRIGQEGVIDTIHFLPPPGIVLSPGLDALVGSWVSAKDFAGIIISASATGLIEGHIDWSDDAGVTVNHTVDSGAFTGGASFALPVEGTHYRVRVDNNAGAPVTFTVVVVKKYQMIQPFSFLVSGTIDPSWNALLTKTVVTGQQPDGDFVNVRADGVALVEDTPLGPNAAFTSAWIDTDGWASAELFISSDQQSALDGIEIEFTDDVGAGTPTVRATLTYTFDSVALAQGYLVVRFPVVLDGLRIVYTNGGTIQGSFYLELDLRTAISNPQGSFTQTLNDSNVAVMTRGIIAAKNSTTYGNIERSDVSGGLKVSLEEINDDIQIQALPTVRTTIVTATASSTQIANPALANRRTISFHARTSNAKNLYLRETSPVASSTGRELAPGEVYELDCDSTVTWFLIEQSGGGASPTLEITEIGD